MDPIKRISEKNESMEILNSSKLRPRQHAIRGSMLMRSWLSALLTQSNKLSFYFHLPLLLANKDNRKITRRCVGAISNTLLTHVKVQIHTKTMTHTLCIDKQEPH